MSSIRVQDASAFKVVALARYSAAKSRDAWFLLFPSYPFFSLRIDGVPISRQATSDSWLSLRSRISPDFADRGFRLSVVNILWCKFIRYLKVQALRFRISRILGQSRILYMDLVIPVESSAFQNLVLDDIFKSKSRNCLIFLSRINISSKTLKTYKYVAMKTSSILSNSQSSFFVSLIFFFCATKSFYITESFYITILNC